MPDDDAVSGPDPAAVGAPATTRGTWQLLADRDFGGLFWGKVIGIVGVWAYAVSAAIAVFDATGSALAVGLVGAAQFVPQVLFAPLSGTWADRGDPRRQLLLGRVLCLVGAGALALWTHLVAPTGWTLAIGVLLGSLTVGMGFVVGGPAMQSVVPRLVSRSELPAAMALNSAPMTAGRVAGPVVGAALAAVTGPAAGFGVAALGQLIFLVLLLTVIRIPPIDRPAAGTDYTVRAAWRFVRSDGALLLLLIAVVAVMVGAEPSITLAPALADSLGAGTWLVGALTASFGVGSGVGLVLVGPLRRHGRANRPVTAGLVCLAAGMAVAAASPWAAGALAGFALAGTGFTLAVTSLSTAVLLRIPAHLRGRVMAFWMVAFVGSRPLASLMVGSISDAASPQLALASAVVVTSAAALVCWWRRPAEQASSQDVLDDVAPAEPDPVRPRRAG
jgi:MFS family permease